MNPNHPTPILHIITRLIVGGAQENTMLTADLLDKSDWQVDVLCGPQTGVEGSLIPEVRRRKIPLTIEPALVREINPLKDLLALWRLTRFIKQGNYTIVHTHSSKAGILGRWAAKFAGTPVIVHTVHGWGHTPRQHPLVQKFYILLEKLTLPITDRLIVVSPRDIEKGTQAGIGTAANFTLIRSGIELDRFGHPRRTAADVRAELGIPPQAPVLGTVTRLSPQKAPLDFVRAAAIVSKNIPACYFVMVGDGPLRPEVERLAAKLGIAERLILTGLRRDIPELMAAFNVFGLSSLWEGLPRVLPQAMATGLPIVATAVDGNAEAVTNGENGFLTPPENPQAFAQAVIKLLHAPNLAQQMGQAGKKRAAQFGAQKMVADIAALYTKLLTTTPTD